MSKRGSGSRRAALAVAIVTVCAVAAAVLASQPEANPNEVKISNDVLQATASGKSTSFVVYLDDQADVSAAAGIQDPDERGRYVYETLRRHAETTQAAVRAQLESDGVAYKPFWAVNMIVVEGGRAVVEDLAARSDVKAIESNAAADGLEDEDEWESTDEGNAIEAVEVGVNNTRSPSLWTLGFTGQGIVIANQDTGMRWTHAALRTRYRGWGGSIAGSDHNYNWWDAIHARITNADGGTPTTVTNSCGYNLVVPCDDNGHGTHTMGTSVGDDAGAGVGTGTNQVGVAPGAKWIGCRNMDAGNGRASTYMECFQFFLAPTTVQGQSPDPTKRPHVMNNSWGCPLVGELCARNVMKTIVENTEAAGIFVETSAGNDGPSCSTVQDPPAIYATSFSTGAINGGTNALVGFSSRGAVTSDGSFRMKPDLSAPGQSVRSSTRTSDTSYGSSSGTSMAGPHVAGVVALLWSARPALVRDMPRTKYLLTRSANPNVTVPNNAAGCGGIGSVPNNHFGWGRVDALAAYNLEPSLNQTISFPAIPGKKLGDADFELDATASSGRAVTYAATGSCTVSGTTVHITGVGPCTVTASQAGLAEYSIERDAPVPYYPAPDVSRTFAVTWSFGGFFQPVDNGLLNVAQAGSALPVKFSLAGDQGLDVLAEGYPRSIAVACPASAPTDAIEQTAAAGQSGLAYDATADRYVYVWKSQKAWAGTCRQLVVKLRDDTEHRASFRFK